MKRDARACGTTLSRRRFNQEVIFVPNHRRRSIVRSRILGHIRDPFESMSQIPETFGQRLESYALVQI